MYDPTFLLPQKIKILLFQERPNLCSRTQTGNLPK